MGQQQLLLIVLGVIIVGIAVVVGINVFTASSVQANKDGLTADVVNLGSMAQQYYRKPTALGGGGNTFTGWTLPGTLDTTGNGTYAATVNAQTVSIVGTGNEKGANGSAVVITATVTPTNITTAVTNP
ncbi:MAG: hypothetical protein A2068_08515 [Ignavibacteria bacterium GWB2_35_6b]|nr:MAG: hypothetical protein A2068_08515 [Ignavibacteria bacterium GWB2_35_6b]